MEVASTVGFLPVTVFVKIHLDEYRDMSIVKDGHGDPPLQQRHYLRINIFRVAVKSPAVNV